LPNSVGLPAFAAANDFGVRFEDTDNLAWILGLSIDHSRVVCATTRLVNSTAAVKPPTSFSMLSRFATTTPIAPLPRPASGTLPASLITCLVVSSSFL